MNDRFSFRFLSVGLLLVLSVILGGCKQGEGNAGGSAAEIAAKVNATTIPLARVDRQVEQDLKPLNVKISDLSPIELAAKRLSTLDQIITQEIMLQRAQRENIQVSDEDVKQQVQRLINNNGWTQEEYQRQLKESGLTEEEFRNEQRSQLLIAKLQERQRSKIPAPSEKEITDYYTQNRDQFKIGRGVYLAQILVDPQNNGLKNDVVGEDKAKQKITELFGRLKSGDDFATVARIASEDYQTGQQGGDMGFAPEETLARTYPEPLIRKFFSMREGEVTEPIQGSNGRWYIFKVTGKKLEEQELKLEDPDVKKRIADIIREQREQVLTGALLIAATNESKVENYLAQRVLDNPSNFGSARPAGSALSRQATQAAEQKPAEAKPEAPKEAPKNGGAAPAEQKSPAAKPESK